MKKLAAVLAVVIGVGIVSSKLWKQEPDQRSVRGHRLIDFIATVDQAEVVCDIEYRPERKIWGDRFENTDEPYLYLSALPNLRLTFTDVEILPNAQLNYGFGANKVLLEPPQGSVTFSIQVDSPQQGRRTLLEQTVTATAAGDPKHIDRLDFAPFVGETVSISFETQANESANSWPAWFDLRLTSDGRELTDAELQCRSRAVATRFTEIVDQATIIQQNPDSPVCQSRARQSGVGGYIEGPGPVLAAAPPSEIRYSVDVAAGSHLETWTALASTTTPEQRAPVRFRIVINEQEVFSRVCRPTAEDNQGAREFVEISLAEYAGQQIEITWSTELLEANEQPVPAGWIYPQIINEQEIPRQLDARDAPSIIMIVIDTLRADRLGCYGASRGASPNLDALAKDAVIGERVVAQSSWTLPSTASLLTGLYPLSHGVLNEQKTFLDDTLESLPEVLAEHGFTTAGFVSNLLLSKESNFHQGFETYQRLSWANAKKLNARFLDWLDNHGELRFFAYLHYVDPHDPYHAPPPFREHIHSPGNSFAGLTDSETFTALASQLPDQPLASLQNPVIAEGMQHLLDLYDSEIYYWDHCFGELMEELRRRNRLDSTIIVVTSDHGEEFLEHRKLYHAQALYEESIRVPLILRGPGLQPRRISDYLEGVDLYPTLLNLVGIGHSSPGRDFLNLKPRPVFSSTELGTIDSVDGMVVKNTVISKPWKLISTPKSDLQELFHLEEDPTESVDLSAANAHLVSSLESMLRAWITETVRDEVGHHLNADPDALEHMRELGYIDR